LRDGIGLCAPATVVVTSSAAIGAIQALIFACSSR
jgi:hypothetical protein